MRGRGPRFIGGLVLVPLLAACAAGGPVGSPGRSSPPRTSLGQTPSRSAAPTAQPQLPPVERLPSAEVAVDGAPGALLSAYGAVWVMSHRSTQLRRIDPASLRVTATVDTGILGCGDLAAEAGSVWVSGCGITPGLVRVDARRLRLVSVTPALNGLGPAFHAGELWIAAGSGGVVGLRHAALDEPDHAREVPIVGLTTDAGVVEAAGSLWVGDESAMVYRVDPATEKVLAAIPLPLDPGQAYLTVHDGAPWFFDPGKGAIVRIDPQTNAPRVLSLRPERPPAYWGVAASSAPGRAGQLWVRNGSEEAWLVDTRQERVIRRVAIADADGGGGDLDEVGGMLWVANFATDTVQRIKLN